MTSSRWEGQKSDSKGAILETKHLILGLGLSNESKGAILETRHLILGLGLSNDLDSVSKTCWIGFNKSYSEVLRFLPIRQQNLSNIAKLYPAVSEHGIWQEDSKIEFLLPRLGCSVKPRSGRPSRRSLTSPELRWPRPRAGRQQQTAAWQPNTTSLRRGTRCEQQEAVWHMLASCEVIGSCPHPLETFPL